MLIKHKTSRKNLHQMVTLAVILGWVHVLWEHASGYRDVGGFWVYVHYIVFVVAVFLHSFYFVLRVYLFYLNLQVQVYMGSVYIILFDLRSSPQILESLNHQKNIKSS